MTCERILDIIAGGAAGFFLCVLLMISLVLWYEKHGGNHRDE